MRYAIAKFVLLGLCTVCMVGGIVPLAVKDADLDLLLGAGKLISLALAVLFLIAARRVRSLERLAEQS